MAVGHAEQSLTCRTEWGQEFHRCIEILRITGFTVVRFQPSLFSSSIVMLERIPWLEANFSVPSLFSVPKVSKVAKDAFIKSTDRLVSVDGHCPGASAPQTYENPPSCSCNLD